jgi:predicted GIY-YIG superfamily endonuclease
MKEHLYFVYILLCSDDTYYTGVTNDINRREKEHLEGYNTNLVFKCRINKLSLSKVCKGEKSLHSLSYGIIF